MGAAGQVKDANDKIVPLRKTVLGKVERVTIVAETDAAGHLRPDQSKGPEIDIKKAPPAGRRGSSFSAAL